MYSDTEMLDWLNRQPVFDWRENTDAEDGNFFSVPSQAITAPTVREAISRAMQIELHGILTGNPRAAHIELPFNT